ncbi:diadenylate cyclase, partial [Escherichia coli]|nr:diadenylate cyclase [Escherichia coli]
MSSELILLIVILCLLTVILLVVSLPNLISLFNAKIKKPRY